MSMWSILFSLLERGCEDAGAVSSVLVALLHQAVAMEPGMVRTQGQLLCCEDIRAVSSVLVALLHQTVAMESGHRAKMGQL